MEPIFTSFIFTEKLKRLTRKLVRPQIYELDIPERTHSSLFRSGLL